MGVQYVILDNGNRPLVVFWNSTTRTVNSTSGAEHSSAFANHCSVMFSIC